MEPWYDRLSVLPSLIMCGRYSLTTPAEQVATTLGAAAIEFPSRFNLAPTDEAAVATLVEGAPRLELYRWGLIPHWAKDPAIGSRMINARAETAAGKPAFRHSFRERRCLVPADGFYEWHGTTPSGKKQPWHLRRRDGEVFAMAGLWAKWRPPIGDTLRSFTILTTEPNELVATLHDRMPVILPRDRWEAWLDPDLDDVEVLRSLLTPLPAEEMTRVAVDPWVNKAGNEGPKCQEVVERQARLF